MTMEIKINLPENCEPDMVTVVYRFHRGIAELAEESIIDFKLAGVTWGKGDCKEIAKLIELVIKEGNNDNGTGDIQRIQSQDCNQ